MAGCAVTRTKVRTCVRCAGLGCAGLRCAALRWAVRYRLSDRVEHCILFHNISTSEIVIEVYTSPRSVVDHITSQRCAGGDELRETGDLLSPQPYVVDVVRDDMVAAWVARRGAIVPDRTQANPHVHMTCQYCIRGVQRAERRRISHTASPSRRERPQTLRGGQTHLPRSSSAAHDSIAPHRCHPTARTDRR